MQGFSEHVQSYCTNHFFWRWIMRYKQIQNTCPCTFLTGLPINIFSTYNFLFLMVAFFRKSSTLSSVKTNMSVLPFLTGFLDIFKQRHIQTARNLAPLANFLGHFTDQYACTVSGICVFEFESLQGFRVDERKRSENATCGHEFFENGEKSCVFKRKRVLVDGALKVR